MAEDPHKMADPAVEAHKTVGGKSAGMDIYILQSCETIHANPMDGFGLDFSWGRGFKRCKGLWLTYLRHSGDPSLWIISGLELGPRILTWRVGQLLSLCSMAINLM